MTDATDLKPTIAVLGGTGNLGRGLSLRWARAGYSVIVGSRSQDRATSAALEISRLTGSTVLGATYRDAARDAEIVVLAVPYMAHKSTLSDIRDAVRGKIVIDTTVPLVPPKVSRVQLPEGGSAALEAQAELGEGVNLVAAFHNVAAAKLQEHGSTVDCDVLVFSDVRDARQQVVDLANAIGLKGWHAGPLANAVVAETLTSTLIFMNRHYKIEGAGIRITGDAN